MKPRVLWSTIATVAAVHVLLVLTARWALIPPVVVEIAPAPKPSEARIAPSLAVERLAETFAGAAFRSVITFDYAALNELVRRAAAWPEVIYLSVEDSQGKIIAHTDPAKIGQSWNAGAAAARGAHQEAVAPVSGAEVPGRPDPRVGQVRLGYLPEEPKGERAPAAPVGPTRPAPDARMALWTVLAAAALAGIPVGFALVKLSGTGGVPRDVPMPDFKKIRTLRQARWTIGHWMREAEIARTQLAAHQTELQRLKDEVAERTERLVQAEAQREQLQGEGARWLGDRERLTAELVARERELEHVRAIIEEPAVPAQGSRLGRAVLEGEVADLRDELAVLREALARHPVVSHGLLDQELRQHRHRVIAYVSHAIRSSLTHVLGFSKLLLRGGDGPLTEAQRTNVLNIHDAGNHLLRVVNDLSELAEVEAGAMELRDEVVDVAAVLREVVATSPSLVARDSQAITVDAPPALPPVRGSERCLSRMFLALMHPPTPDGGGPVELSAQAGDEFVTLVVTHRRASVPAQDLPSLFDPFSPIDVTATLQDDGGRLRLALAKELAATLGGHLIVETHEDTDTVFTVTLPVAADVSALA